MVPTSGIPGPGAPVFRVISQLAAMSADVSCRLMLTLLAVNEISEKSKFVYPS